MKAAFFEKNTPTPIAKIEYRLPTGQSSQFWVKRDDLIDPKISGNKWRKLKFNIKEAITLNYQGIASFGGAFSNHIAALSSATKRCGLKSIGFIRGDQIDPANPTLALARENGMAFHLLSREDYRNRHDPEFIKSLQVQYPNFLFVPEGGSNQQAEEGLAELAQEISQQGEFDFVACPIGSGGTISGLSRSLQSNTLGIAVVKDSKLISNLKAKFGNKLTVHQEAIFGGYAKFSKELEMFCLDFIAQTGVIIEPIYSGKMMYALCHHQQQLGIKPNDRVLAIHTGGLQGLKGLAYRRQIDVSLWKNAVPSLAL